MSQSKSFLRTVLDAMMDARTRQAERTLANYRSTVDTYSHHADKR